MPLRLKQQETLCAQENALLKHSGGCSKMTSCIIIRLSFYMQERLKDSPLTTYQGRNDNIEIP